MGYGALECACTGRVGCELPRECELASALECAGALVRGRPTGRALVRGAGYGRLSALVRGRSRVRYGRPLRGRRPAVVPWTQGHVEPWCDFVPWAQAPYGPVPWAGLVCLVCLGVVLGWALLGALCLGVVLGHCLGHCAGHLGHFPISPATFAFPRVPAGESRLISLELPAWPP